MPLGSPEDPLGPLEDPKMVPKSTRLYSNRPKSTPRGEGRGADGFTWFRGKESTAQMPEDFPRTHAGQPITPARQNVQSG